MRLTAVLLCGSMLKIGECTPPPPPSTGRSSSASVSTHPSFVKGGRALESGEAACEGHGHDKGACLAVGCCEWDKGRCWSAVGAAECGDGSGGAATETSTEDERHAVCESGEASSETDCVALGCCHWGEGVCWAQTTDSASSCTSSGFSSQFFDTIDNYACSSNVCRECGADVKWSTKSDTPAMYKDAYGKATPSPQTCGDYCYRVAGCAGFNYNSAQGVQVKALLFHLPACALPHR